MESVDSIKPLKDALAAIPAAWPEESRQKVAAAINAKIEKIHASRGTRGNKAADGRMFDGGDSATEAGE